MFLADMGMTEPGLDRLIHATYDLLGLQTYFTAGEKEVRAWTIHKGDTAPQAAGVIHTDFEKGFIRAEVIAYDDYVRAQGRAAAPRKPARCAWRARSTSCRTATSCTSGSTSRGDPMQALALFRGYQGSWFKADLVAGLTAAAIVIPKAMAYATIAGLPVQVGLYTAFIPMVVYALLGTSSVLSVSSTTTIAILSAAALGEVGPGAPRGEHRGRGRDALRARRRDPRRSRASSASDTSRTSFPIRCSRVQGGHRARDRGRPASRSCSASTSKRKASFATCCRSPGMCRRPRSRRSRWRSAPSP